MTTALNNIRRFTYRYNNDDQTMIRMDKWTLVKSQWNIRVRYYNDGVSAEIEGFGSENETKFGSGYSDTALTAFRQARKNLNKKWKPNFRKRKDNIKRFGDIDSEEYTGKCYTEDERFD